MNEDGKLWSAEEESDPFSDHAASQPAEHRTEVKHKYAWKE